MFKKITTFFRPVNWHNLRNIKPISRVFGFDRGTPIDRHYIESFLANNQTLIRGRCLEIADNLYSRKYGINIVKSDVLYVDDTNPKATIIGDLTKSETLPQEEIDCFICTQTLNVIYDFHSAIKSIHSLLKPNGVALVTVAGLCQISQYDMERWGDYWRFTDLSIGKSFKDVFGDSNVEVTPYGNLLSAVALLEGISAEELTSKELDYTDKAYQVVLSIKACKR